MSEEANTDVNVHVDPADLQGQAPAAAGEPASEARPAAAAFSDLSELEGAFEICTEKVEGGRFMVSLVMDFWKEVSEIEFKAAQKLRKLAERGAPKRSGFKKLLGPSSDAVEKSGTLRSSWDRAVRSVLEQCDRRTAMTENLSKDVVETLRAFQFDADQSRASVIDEGRLLQSEVKKALNSMEKLQKSYFKRRRDLQQAEKDDSDLRMSGIVDGPKVAKIQEKVSTLRHRCTVDNEVYKQSVEDCKLSQEVMLEKMPLLLQKLQKLEEDRIEALKKAIESAAFSYIQYYPTLHQMTDKLIHFVDDIDKELDIAEFVNATTKAGVKSNFQFAAYVPYEGDQDEDSYVIQSSHTASEVVPSAPPTSYDEESGSAEQFHSTHDAYAAQQVPAQQPEEVASRPSGEYLPQENDTDDSSEGEAYTPSVVAKQVSAMSTAGVVFDDDDEEEDIAEAPGAGNVEAQMETIEI